ncbi:cAMP-binding domain of CRP or a regulatory subunit of cAMP-dependent protein kinases [Mariprofundus aestuarium]|uniref:cAMP-binding domain of CRP or a regulatory subunit of cAMP-dependent protein kinases n=1 Tax=Mariprofundus aestuarium TaxID=1921086 RepID=A0A2K8L324_MARES|nr:cyclic nucleotide-binding domain-containing protein [Mariprofundus aestuarium]ATX80619.1 cAMP-binding domain of CRP or a regulatory subunit of cAMP-dependent protein kinases [Mariprofundus aestuarium]
MSKIVSFSTGESLINQGDEDTIAYLIQSGWVQINQKKEDGTSFEVKIGPGEIVGELALVGLVTQRSASATAITAVEAEEIDRGALIRLVNGPASKLTPVLAALLSRLKNAMVDEKQANVFAPDDTIHARVVGLNDISKQALCNQPCEISRLPWVFGSHVPPQSVTDLLRHQQMADTLLANASKRVREQHLCIETDGKNGLQLQLMQHGDYCEVNDKRVGYGASSTTVPLQKGDHTVSFGDPVDPYAFGIEIL